MKIILLPIFLLSSMSVFADSGKCDKLALVAHNNGGNFGDVIYLKVNGSKGFRTYFHTAPSTSCKSNIFIISNDKVRAYQDFRNDGQTWLNVEYTAKNGTTVDGWVKAKDFGEAEIF